MAERSVQKNWKCFLVIGILLLILGIVSIGAVFFTTLFTVYFLGLILVIGGVAKLIHSFWMKKWDNFFLSLGAGLLYVVVGALLLARPIQSAAALTLLIGALFVIGGLFRGISAMTIRFEQWGWAFFSGLVSLILGVMVLIEWPISSLWIIGLFVSIDLIVYGITMISTALDAKEE